MADGSDNFADAPLVALGTVGTPFWNIGFTVEAGEPSPATDPASEWLGATWAFQRSAWWKFEAAVDQDVQVHSQRSAYGTYTPDTLISVFQSSVPGDPTLADLVLVARGSLEDGGGIGDTHFYTPWAVG